jgi:hypothetical protein
MSVRLSLLILGWLFIGMFHLQAAIHYVDAASTNPVAPYLSWSTAAATIQHAVDAASASDDVIVTNGVYATGGKAINGTLINRIAITRPIKVISVNGAESTIVKGSDRTLGSPVRGVYLGSNATISGFTITTGNTLTSGDLYQDQSGGGLFCESSSSTVSDCVIVNCSANQMGGAVYSGTLNNCNLTANSARLYGGAYSSTLNRCLISANFRGGVFSCKLNNCALWGNWSDDLTAAAAMQCSLNNCTVVFNNSYYITPPTSQSECHNCIIYYNSTPEYDDTSSLDHCCTYFLPPNGSENISFQPKFANAGNADWHLQFNSPCIDAGSNIAAAGTTDLGGNPRVTHGTVDIGAYEFQGTAPPRITHYVTLNSFHPEPPYTSWATAATNIQDAIDIALPNSEVVVSNGIYGTGGHGAPNSVTNRIEANKPIIVRSINGASVTRIEGSQVPGTTNGAGAIRCAWMANDATLSGFTLANGATRGNADGDESRGGGVWCDETAWVSNCVIINNSARYGGGVYGGRVRNCILIGNSAVNDGGGARSSSLVGCVVSTNAASIGGGAAWSSLTNCLFESNSAAELGGGAARSTLTRCQILNNSKGGTYGCNLESCLVAGNTGFAAGVSGFWNFHQPAAVSVRNCTVVSNMPTGTMWCYLTNCIVIFNGAAETNNYEQSEPIFDYEWHCCIRPEPRNGFGCITNDPLFVDPRQGNFRLQSNSPCINTGDSISVATITDIDGNPRIRDGIVDIGAYEFQHGASSLAPPLAITLSGQNATLSWPLWASNFVLHAASGIPPNSGGWLPVSAPVTTTEQDNQTSLPLDGSTKFFRLLLP